MSFLNKWGGEMDNERLEKYINLEQEISNINIRKGSPATRKIYKRFLLKFIRILLENNIEISSIKSIKNEHLKQYADIEITKGRSIEMVIKELRGVYFYWDYINRNTASFRRKNLVDIRILEKNLRGWHK